MNHNHFLYLQSHFALDFVIGIKGNVTVYNLRNVKRPKDKFKRLMKYWRVSYQQASEKERLSLWMFALVMLVYTWWAILVF